MRHPNLDTVFEREITELYEEALDALKSQDYETSWNSLKEATRLTSFQKRLSEAESFLKRRGMAADATANMTDVERTAALVEYAYGVKAKAAYLKKVEQRRQRQLEDKKTLPAAFSNNYDID